MVIEDVSILIVLMFFHISVILNQRIHRGFQGILLSTDHYANVYVYDFIVDCFVLLTLFHECLMTSDLTSVQQLIAVFLTILLKRLC